MKATGNSIGAKPSSRNNRQTLGVKGCPQRDKRINVGRTRRHHRLTIGWWWTPGSSGNATGNHRLVMTLRETCRATQGTREWGRMGGGRNHRIHVSTAGGYRRWSVGIALGIFTGQERIIRQALGTGSRGNSFKGSCVHSSLRGKFFW